MDNFTPVSALAGGVLIGAASVWLLAALAGLSSPRENFSPWWAATAGALVGFGTRIGGGCTSGHGVCGLGRFSVRSLVAVWLSGMANPRKVVPAMVAGGLLARIAAPAGPGA